MCVLFLLSLIHKYIFLYFIPKVGTVYKNQRVIVVATLTFACMWR